MCSLEKLHHPGCYSKGRDRGSSDNIEDYMKGVPVWQLQGSRLYAIQPKGRGYVKSNNTVFEVLGDLQRDSVPQGTNTQGYDPESKQVLIPCLNFQSGDEPTKCHENTSNHSVSKLSSCEEPFNLSVSSQRSPESCCHPASKFRGIVKFLVMFIQVFR